MNLMKIIYEKGTPEKKMCIMSHLDNVHHVCRVKSVNVGAAARRASTSLFGVVALLSRVGRQEGMET